jgi:hypothetical protein
MNAAREFYRSTFSMNPASFEPNPTAFPIIIQVPVVL